MYLGDVGLSLMPDSPKEVVYPDKSLFKAKGSVWHQKGRKANRIPQGVRAIDRRYLVKESLCGWVYGYGLHLTV